MLPQMHENKIHGEEQLPVPFEKRIERRRSRIVRIGAIISVVGGMLTFLGYFLPMATFSDEAHHPVLVEGDANFLLPFIACIVIGLSVALVVQTKQPWLVYLCLGIAILVGLITHYYFCMRFLILPPPVSGPGYFDFDVGALLPFLGLFLSLGGSLVCLTHRKPFLSRWTYYPYENHS
jgi:hypothetical protein